MTLGSKIKLLRKQKQISQAELARQAGVNPSHLSRLESGRYSPSAEVVRRLAEALEVSTDYLLGEEEAPAADLEIRNKPLAERLRLIEALDEADQEAIIRVIDSMLIKQRMRQVLQDGPAL